MPELPEVETVARGLAQGVAGRRVARMQLDRADLRTKLPPGLAARSRDNASRASRAAPSTSSSISRAAACCSRISACRAAWCWAPTAPTTSASTTTSSSPSTTARCCASTTPAASACSIIAASEEALASPSPPHPSRAGAARQRIQRPRAGRVARRQGDADQGGAARPARRRRARQHICVRSLYWAGVSPRRLAGTVGAARAERLAHAIRDVLERAIAAGGSSLRDYVQASGELGYFQHHWAVYGKEGERCPGCDCGKAIRRIVQAGRSTFYCAKRQR